MPAVTHEQIEALALASGFEPKPQPDGSMALHPHVFEFARQLLAAGQSLPVIDWQPIETAPRAPLPVLNELPSTLLSPVLTRWEPVLVFCEDGRIHVACHAWLAFPNLSPDGLGELCEGWLVLEVGGLLLAECRPTHWAAIAPPTAAPSATPTAE